MHSLENYKSKQNEQTLNSSFIQSLLTFNFASVGKSVILQKLNFSVVQKIVQKPENHCKLVYLQKSNAFLLV